MDNSEFRKQAHAFADWMADYLERAEELPVKSQAKPGDIFKQLPVQPPANGEPMDDIFRDFRDIILPGITHWQSPNFFGYFPANSSFPSVLAEMLTATIGAQCMKWETSPAAAELEEMMMNWLKQMTGLPHNFEGVIQDSASTATLVAILSAREKASGFRINSEGFTENDRFRVYCSTETHSSIEKAVKIAGIGNRKLVKVATDPAFRMDPAALKSAIIADLEAGLHPMCVVATLGTTGCTAIDPLPEIAAICREYNLWLHVDAAFAGSALILPEYRWMIDGVEQADSFVFNPHKWLFTNFDCSAYFVKDRSVLLNTLQLVPEYLKTHDQGQVNDYCDWSVPLGRRFRALKLWFVIRSYGVEAMQEKLRYHISLAKELEEKIAAQSDFELLAPRTLNLLCFRYRPEGVTDEAELNRINEELLKRINRTGRAFLTHTKLNGKYTIRMSIAQTNVERRHVEECWQIVQSSKGKGQS
jgi:aromatic-L-amino-acid/L-tryptophan decarboxylase